MGGVDKLVRLVVALLLIVAYFNEIVIGWLGIVFLIVAGIFILTSIINFCPIYAMLGMNSCPIKKES